MYGDSYATLDSYFGEGNNLTHVGGGYGNEHSQEYRTNGSYHNDVSSGSCSSGGGGGGDPSALARANLEWEQQSEQRGGVE